MTRHPLDVASLLFGLLAVAAAAVWLVLDPGDADADDLVWGAPIALVVLGVLGIAVSLRGGFHSSGADEAG